MAMTKAIILDASCFSGNNLRNEIKAKIRCGDLVPIWSKSGKLAKELKQADFIRFREYAKAGKCYCVCNICVERKTNHLKSNCKLESNDGHIVALALVSGANTLVTNDCLLIKDFKDCNEIDKSSRCRTRQGTKISRKVIQTSSPSSSEVSRLLREATVKYKHCLCQCSQSGC
jgi:hypothetical protein